MLNYDFKILHPNEFECFTRDLLQASEHLRIESFAEGRDGGIDLRFAYDSTKKCIVQCKRYKDWNELKNTLKKEVEKVKKINPDRYILSTSVDLTAKNKDEIKELFSPYIKDTAKDILGQSDLNNLLGQHHEIEKQYYKLWLGSSNVLETIVHKNVINWSEFELDEIKSEIAKYVTNDSFYQAEKILTENRYVIISGIPGIGKTTLARMLVYKYLAHGYEEFVYIVDDLDNASKVYEKNKKQVFFFDDFLGSNFFDIQKQSTSFENKLITFINRIKKSPNSLFIMTTREYVLSDAKNYYEKLDLNKIDIAKCTIDLSNYTELVRAKILYNHLAEANMPSEYIDVLIEDKNYEQIIKHPNFNPRVIEAFINQKIWNDVPSEKFMSSVMNFFDNPLSVWKKAFENMNPFARYALLVFATFGGFAYYEEWCAAFKFFCKTTDKDLNIVYDDIVWKKTIKILQDCFIQINISQSNISVTPFNPSILDFCVSFIRENLTTQSILLKSVLYPEQLTSLFTDSKKQSKSSKHKITVSDDLSSFIYDVACNCFLKMLAKKRCPLINESRTDTRFCLSFINNFPVLFNSHHRDFIGNNYNSEELYDDNISPWMRFELMKYIPWKTVPMKPKDVLLSIITKETLDMSDLEDYVKTSIQLGLSSILNESDVHSNIKDQLIINIDYVDNFDDLQKLEMIIDEINDHLPYLHNELRSYIATKDEELTNDAISELSRNDKPYNEQQEQDNIDLIHEMFTSLYDNQ